MAKLGATGLNAFGDQRRMPLYESRFQHIRYLASSARSVTELNFLDL